MRREQGHRRNVPGRKAVILALVAGLNLTGAGAALAVDVQPFHNQATAATIHHGAPAAPAGNTQPVPGSPYASSGKQSPEPHTEVEIRIREGEGRMTRRTDGSSL